MSLHRPGANTLRGGRNVYSTNALEGNWFEERYNPARQAEVPAFFNSQFESTAHAQEHEATGRAPPSVGAGVEQDGDRFDRDYNYANVIQYDSRSQPQHWAALTKAAHADPRTGGKATEFGVAKRTKPHPVTDDPARTADYRGRWTLEADRSFAADRFTPMSVASLAPGDPARKFARRTTRALPGAPLAVESLREAAIGRAGSLALDALRGQLLAMDESGDGRLSKEEFRWAVSDFGVEMDAPSLDQVFAWFDRDGNGYIDVPEFIEGIRGSLSDERASLIAAAWERLAGASADAVTQGAVADAAAKAEGRTQGSGAALRAVADRAEGGRVTRAQFESQFASVSAATDRDHDFEAMLPQ